MNVIETALPGMLIVEPKVVGDARGFFVERITRSAMPSRHHTSVRAGQPIAVGPAVAWPAFSTSQAAGKARDRAARRGTRCGGRRTGWQSDIRQAPGGRAQRPKPPATWIPRGFAHGFIVRSDIADFFYKCDEVYSPVDERVLRWNDPALGIDWSARTRSCRRATPRAGLRGAADMLPRFRPV